VAALYVDAFFYIALINVNDRHHATARALSQQHAAAAKVTSEPVLVEVFAWAAARGTYHRRLVLTLLDDLRRDGSTTIVRQTPALFDAGVELYGRRPDKGYSLTDTMSMAVCLDHGIEQVLTHDRHFAQEGFEILV